MSGDRRRGAMYCWPTWISPLLSGEDRCEWAAWYRSHFLFEKLPRDDEADLEQWRAQHDEMTERRARILEADGYSVTVEEYNAFKMKGRDRGDGKHGIFAGRPDIVAIKGPRVLIVDEKSGRKRGSDVWQVKIYQFALQRVAFKNQNVLIEGAVEYRDGLVMIGALTPDDTAKIRTVLAMVGDPDVEPPHAPSLNECRFCNIAACQKRINAPTPKEGDASDVF